MKNSLFARIFFLVFLILIFNQTKIFSQVWEEIVGAGILYEAIAIDVTAVTVEGVAVAGATDASAAVIAEALIANAAEGTVFTVTSSAGTTLVANPSVWAGLFTLPTVAALIDIGLEDRSKGSLGPVQFGLLPIPQQKEILSLRRGLKVGDKITIRKWYRGLSLVKTSFEKYKNGNALHRDSIIVKMFFKGQCWGEVGCVEIQSDVKKFITMNSDNFKPIVGIFDSIPHPGPFDPGNWNDLNMPRLEDLIYLSDQQLLRLLKRYEKTTNRYLVDLIRNFLASRRIISGEGYCDIYPEGFYAVLVFEVPGGIIIQMVENETFMHTAIKTYGHERLVATMNIEIMAGCAIEVQSPITIMPSFLNVYEQHAIVVGVYKFLSSHGFHSEVDIDGMSEETGFGSSAFSHLPKFSEN